MILDIQTKHRPASITAVQLGCERQKRTVQHVLEGDRDGREQVHDGDSAAVICLRLNHAVESG